MGSKNWHQGKNIITLSPYYFWESSWLRKVAETYRIIVENNKRGVCFHCSCSLEITAGFYFCFCLIILPQKEFFFLGHTVLPNAICLWVKASKSQMNHKSCPKASSTAVKCDPRAQLYFETSVTKYYRPKHSTARLTSFWTSLVS